MPHTNTPRTISSRVLPRLSRPTRAFLLGLVVGVLGTTLLLVFTPPTESRTESIFVYGTLQNPIIRSLTCLCRTEPTPETLNGYEKVGRNIIPNARGVVNGSIIKVTETELARLDRYERVPHKYRRTRITIDNTEHWVYLLNDTASSPPASI